MYACDSLLIDSFGAGVSEKFLKFQKFLGKEIALRKRNDLSDEILAKIGQKRPISLTISQCHSNMVTEGGLRDLFRNCGESLQVS